MSKLNGNLVVFIVVSILLCQSDSCSTRLDSSRHAFGPRSTESQQYVALFDTTDQPIEFPNGEVDYDLDSTAATLLENRDNYYIPNGYSLVSLSAYGWPDIRYASLWGQFPGPEQILLSEIDRADAVTLVASLAEKGFIPTIVAVSGPVESAKFSVVLEKSELQSKVLWAIQDNVDDSLGASWPEGQWELSYVAAYGAPGDPWLCAIWRENSNNVDKGSHITSQTSDSAMTNFDHQVTKIHWRPAGVASTSNGRITTYFTDTQVGHGALVLGQSADEVGTEWYERQLAAQTPIRIAGAGDTWYNAIFHSIWANQYIPKPRKWDAVGTATGLKDNDAAIAAVDSILQTFMQQTGVRQAQLAFGQGGNVLLERAFSWSEPEWQTPLTGDMFLLASVSKMFCVAAIKTLIDTNKLKHTTRPWAELQAFRDLITDTSDTRLLDITVDHLINHYAGWNPVEDFIFQMPLVSRKLSLSGPPSAGDFVTFLTRDVRLDTAPGFAYHYSNDGYIVLSYVVEVVSGVSYFDYLQSAVLEPIGLRDLVKGFVTEREAHLNDRVIQDTSFVGQNPQSPNDPSDIISNVFGGDGIWKETAVGPSSLAASASTLVKFANYYCTSGYGPRCDSNNPAGRQGDMDGAETFVASRVDGIDWALVLNTRELDQDVWTQLVNIDISSFLDTGPVLGE